MEMSTQEDVNANAYEYVLYYIHVDQRDEGIYPTNLVGVCKLVFSENNTIICNSWALNDGFPAPTNDQLLSYSLASVRAWFNGYYVIPAKIAGSQSYKISARDLALVRTDASMIGYQVFETTTKIQKIFNGKSWIAATMSPSISSAWSNESVSVSFGESFMMVLINLPGFTQSEDSSSEWKVDMESGKHTYFGQPRPFRVSIDYETQKIRVDKREILSTYICKNGVVCTNEKTLRESFDVGASLSIANHCVNDVIMMSHGETIQLAAIFSADVPSEITFSGLSYAINGC